jgi:hypothetical protein
MVLAQLTSIVQENQTFDEGMHLAAGLSYLRTGDYRMNPEQPPLGKILSAFPLLFTSARLPLEHPAWKSVDQYHFGQAFLYENNLTPDQLLLLGRLPTIVLTALLGVILAWWTRLEFGAAASLLAVFLFATDPNLIAHGRYVTSDLIAALAFFLSVVTWTRFLYLRSTASLVLAGLALGLALASKFSTVVLPPILILLYLVRARQEKRFSLSHLLKSLLAACGIAVIVVGIIYWPETRRARQLPRLAESVDRNHRVGYVFHRFGKAFRAPAHAYLLGLHGVAVHNADGHESYLLGQQSRRGWWYYFPVAFAVKTPSAVLLLTLLSIGVLLRAPPRGESFRWIALALPMLFYFLLSTTSGINIGLRHLLPVYPFLFAIVAAAFFRLPFRANARRLLLGTILLVQTIEVASIHPHYLAFFNRLSGGPLAGPYYLVDSNIDWGQDLKKLRRYMDVHRLENVCLSYFGSGDPRYYGIAGRHLPTSEDAQGRAAINCVAAISVTLLRDVYTAPGSYEWLRGRQRVDHVGYSIWIYDLRKKAELAYLPVRDGIVQRKNLWLR